MSVYYTGTVKSNSLVVYLCTEFNVHKVQLGELFPVTFHIIGGPLTVSYMFPRITTVHLSV